MGPELTITQEMINQFADLTGDHQWIHVDVERAAAREPLGGPIAHGFLTLSLLPRMMTGEQHDHHRPHERGQLRGDQAPLHRAGARRLRPSTAGTGWSKPWPDPRARCSPLRSRSPWSGPTGPPCSTPCRRCICDAILIGAPRLGVGSIARPGLTGGRQGECRRRNATHRPAVRDESNDRDCPGTHPARGEALWSDCWRTRCAS